MVFSNPRIYPREPGIPTTIEAFREKMANRQVLLNIVEVFIPPIAPAPPPPVLTSREVEQINSKILLIPIARRSAFAVAFLFSHTFPPKNH